MKYLSMVVGVLLFVATTTCINATPLDYQFTATTGSAIDMTGATSLGWGAWTDDVASSVMNIGFTFTFAGTGYTQFSVNSNGCIGLGSTQVTDSYVNEQFPSTWWSGDGYPMIAPFWEDLQVSPSAGAGVRYKLVGTSPDQVLVVEWDEMMWAHSTSIIYTFQARLYEGSNRIEFLYSSMPTSQNTYATIGMAGTTTDYLSVTPGSPATISGTSANNYIDLASTSIPSGTMYVFNTCPTGLPYAFAPGSGEGIDMTGSTSLGWGAWTDDAASSVMDIGFTFNFAGTDYTQFSVNTNGMIALGPTAVTPSWVNEDFPGTGFFTGGYPMIAPLWEDLQISGVAGAGVRYMIVGSSPDRMLVVEWDEMMWAHNEDVIYTFQTRLYEGSNRIEYLYIAMPTSQGTSATIGMAASSSDFLSVTPGAIATISGSSADNYIDLSSSSTYLSSGTMFTFDPTAVSVTGADVAACFGTDATLSVVATGPRLTYQWMRGATPISGATSPTMTLEGIEAADLGVYTCVVTGVCDEASTDVTLALPAAPTLAVTMSPAILWPPNHTMTNVTATLTPGGECGPFTVALTSFVSNEPDDANGNGDGNTVDDVQGDDLNTADEAFMLRAERAGSGQGRTYTATYVVTDASEQSTTQTATVFVPHDEDLLKPSTINVPILGMMLDQNIPNPFSTQTVIRYWLAEPATIALKIYSLAGAEIATLASGPMIAGSNGALWDGRDAAGTPMPSGTYICRLTANGQVQQLPMVLAR